jgi:hypothetical protein
VFVHALSQQTWIELARRNYAKTIGTSISLQSGGLRTVFAPEADMTAAMAFNELCLYPESLEMLTTFRKSYERSFFWLREHTKKKDSTEALYPAALAYLNGRETAVPERVTSEWIRSPIFLSNQQAINSSFAQEKVVPGAIKGAESYNAGEGAKLAALRRKVARQEASEMAKAIRKKANEAEAGARSELAKQTAAAKKAAETERDRLKKAALAKSDAKKAEDAPREAARLESLSRENAKKASEAEAVAKAAADAIAPAKAEVEALDSTAKAETRKAKDSVKAVSTAQADLKKAIDADVSAKPNARKAQAALKLAVGKA